MGNGIGLVDINGQLQASVTSSFIGSGSLNQKRLRPRRFYDRRLQGLALKTEVGEARGTGDSNLYATPPSWTQRLIGKAHAYVMPALSSSVPEVQNNNAYVSGTEKLEATAVPASGALYYSKQSSLITRVYAVTASANLSTVNATPTGAYAGEFGTRANFVAASGTLITHTDVKPARIQINVPDSGRLQNIRVWVELVSDVRTPDAGARNGSTFPASLGTMMIALRPPMDIARQNSLLDFNDPTHVASSFFNSDTIYYNSYMLWYGNILPLTAKEWTDTDPSNLNTTQSFQVYNLVSSSVPRPPLWYFDLDMRTVFDDSAPVRYPADCFNILGGDYTFKTGSRDCWQVSASAPNVVYLTNYESIGTINPSPYGHWFPWFVDPKIKAGRLQVSGSVVYYNQLVSGSPPTGWLTGPGGSNNVNEWPTTGSNLGPNSIRPALPLLDDIYYTCGPVASASVGSGLASIPPYVQKGTAIRRGLRGIDINGRWELLLGTAASNINVTSGTLGYGFWFRQVRLELTYSTGRSPATNIRRGAFKRTSTTKSGGKRVYSIIPGGFNWHFDTNNAVIVPETPQPGRSVGITDTTASFAEYAVFSRITGTLADTLSSLSASSVFYTFLHNDFGTPYIPISSASLNPANQVSQFSTIDDGSLKKSIISGLKSFSPLAGSNDIRSALSRQPGYFRTRQQIVSDIISSGSV